jgi:hypothetical protein
MVSMVDSLSEGQRVSLEREFQTVEPTAWVVEIAHQKSWREANEAFLQKERAMGRVEMTDLMNALRIERPVSPSQAAGLVATAYRLFLGERTGDVELADEYTVKLRVCDCPTFRRLEAGKWTGVTACSSWHRRRGWYDAMGAQPLDSVVAESKWGDEFCEAIIEFPRPSP